MNVSDNQSLDVCNVARETVVKMATILDPRYLKYVIKEMKELPTIRLAGLLCLISFIFIPFWFFDLVCISSTIIQSDSKVFNKKKCDSLAYSHSLCHVTHVM